MLEIEFLGEPLVLQGKQLAVGDKLPDVRLFDKNMQSVDTADTSGVRVFLTVPSLDTPICDLEVRNFNEKASELNGVTVYAVSVDLPFAQARWCGTHGIERVITLSDYNGAEFGRASGSWMAEFALLARAIFVVDADNVVRYVQFVSNVNSHPDYQAAYTAVADLV